MKKIFRVKAGIDKYPGIAGMAYRAAKNGKHGTEEHKNHESKN
jgi:hypothetical protein